MIALPVRQAASSCRVGANNLEEAIALASFADRTVNHPRRASLGRLACGCVSGLLLCAELAYGGGFDHRVEYDNSGIWKRSNQQVLQYGLIGGEIAGALWLGGEDRLGKTFWQAIDASAVGGVTSEAMKRIFTRSRPTQSPNPDLWFQGRGHYSFPSGEVTTVTAIVTPFVLEYGRDYPAVYALELLPAYDAIARVKARAHWQTDVLASFALGTAAGYLAHERESPVILGVLPHGFMVGLRKQF
ncbi:MAG TPA: phosphatase PAP2 family protein [Casimicrobiaceae bacterium]